MPGASPACRWRSSANGSGPTVILEGGNHGDEYEGPIVITELIRELDPGEIQGRLILMPAINAPAVIAGQRTSPDDGLNLNRSFPGDPHGSMTQQIAAFMADEIYPRGDAFLDLHSGGSSLDLLPSAIIEPTEDAALSRRNIAAALAFDAPQTVVISNLGDPRTATAAACRAGLVTMGTEMGGGGTVSPEALAICRRGVRNVLAHLGLLPPERAEPRRGDGQHPGAAREQRLRLCHHGRHLRALPRQGPRRARRRARRPHPLHLGPDAPRRDPALSGGRNPLRPAPARPRAAGQLLPGRRGALWQESSTRPFDRERPCSTQISATSLPPSSPRYTAPNNSNAIAATFSCTARRSTVGASTQTSGSMRRRAFAASGTKT